MAHRRKGQPPLRGELASERANSGPPSLIVCTAVRTTEIANILRTVPLLLLTRSTREAYRISLKVRSLFFFVCGAGGRKEDRGLFHQGNQILCPTSKPPVWVFAVLDARASAA